MSPDNKDDEWRKVKENWGKAWEKKRELMLGDFAATIRSAQIACVGAVVDARHFRLLAKQDSLFADLHKDPIHLSFHIFVMGGIEKTEVIDKHAPIGIVVDEDPEFAMGCYEQLTGLKQAFPKVQERVHAISFVNDASYPGIQAADIISYESRRLMVERITKPDAEASELFLDLTLHGTHQPNFYTPAVLDKLQASNPLKGQDDNAAKQS
jgi:hypothetical protein